MRTLLTVLLTLMLALAGCTEDPKDADMGSGDGTGDGDDGTGDGNGTSDGNGTDGGTGSGGSGSGGSGSGGSGGGEGNESVVNSIPSMTFSANRSTGQIPFFVTFHINATDADGDDLTWALLRDGNESQTGDVLPNNISIEITEEGDFNFTAVVTDGQAETNASILIQATVSEPTYNGPGPVTWSAYGIGTPLGCLSADADFTAYFDYDASLAGVWNFKTTWEPTQVGIVTEWWNGDSHTEDLGESGVIPAPSDNVAVCADAGGASFTLTLYHPDDPTVS